MQLRLRPLLFAASALFAVNQASAQFIDLVTEAPVTFQVVLNTSNTTTTSTGRTTTTATTRLTQAQVLEELRVAGVIPAENTVGWSLVAVRAAPADLVFVNAAFTLYAINPALESRVLVPQDKFGASAFSSVGRFTEKHQGQYVISSTGTLTSHVAYDYRPNFTTPTGGIDVSESNFNGYARINFTAKDIQDGHEIFFYAIRSVSVTARGGFTGTITQGEESRPARGIATLTINVGPAKLVPATLYPDVPTYDGVVSLD